MSTAELSRLKAECEMAKAVWVACEKRYSDAYVQVGKKPKPVKSNPWIEKQLRKEKKAA